MRKIGVAIVLAFSLLLFEGCGHGALEKRIDEKLAQESAVRTNGDFRARMTGIIETAPGLNAEQKSKLFALRESTKSRLEKMGLESRELRSILVKDLLAENYDEDEVAVVKNRIKRLENERLTVVFEAVDQANTILGRESLIRRPMMDVFMSRIGPVD